MKRIDCVCGHVVEAEDDDQLWEDAQEHLRTDHPDLVGKVSREDILAQAEETYDHWIVIGRVDDLRTSLSKDPLVFFAGAFGTLQERT